MIFTLEALDAKHGDALLLHYGEADSPHLIVIDGGPSKVYKSVLKQRLDEIKESCTPDDRLPIRLVVVSHIDDDHIHGILDLTEELFQLQGDRKDLPYKIQGLWHNNFDDIVGHESDCLFASLETAAVSAAATGRVPGNLPLSLPSALIVASVNQGRSLRDKARALTLEVNKPFPGLVLAPKQGQKTVAMEGGLSFTILGPNQQHLEDLQKEWDKQLKELKAKPAAAQAIAAAFVDDSVYNLSSIILLAAVGNRRMLLTGDARGDNIMAGLKTAGLFQGDRFHADILKLPHHGSDRNIAPEFFERVTADHYVISANGKYGNPEISTLKMLSEARGEDNYTIYLTNQEARLVEFFKQEKASGKRYQVVFRNDNSRSIRILLGD